MVDAPKTVRLADEGSPLEATFVPSAGMLCCSLKHRGEELLAQRSGLEAYARLGKTMGIPLLYPWANRLAGFEYTAAGRTVAVPRDPARIALDGGGLPIHGVIGGRQSWQVAPPRAGAGAGESPAAGERSPSLPKERSPSAPQARGPSALTATLTWSARRPELFEVFPFRHDARYEAALADGALRATVTVQACGDDHVPVAFGFHPYLSPPGAERERYEIELPPMRRLALDARQIPTGPDRAAPARRGELGGDVFDDGFDSLGQPATFAVQAGGRRIEMVFEQGYPCAQVYAPEGGQFICYEPMTAPANALRSGAGLNVLAPGERCSATWELRVRDEPPAGE
jgi:aldose 1-epimerase